MTDAPEPPAAARPASPETIDQGFSNSTAMALLQMPLRRDGYFHYAHYFHDELIPDSIFLHICYFDTFFFLNIQCSSTPVCVCDENEDELQMYPNNILS